MTLRRMFIMSFSLAALIRSSSRLLRCSSNSFAVSFRVSRFRAAFFFSSRPATRKMVLFVVVVVVVTK